MRVFLSCIAISVVACVATPTEMKPPASFDHAIAPVFAADLPEALKRLAALPEAAMDEPQRRVRDCMQARFAQPPREAAGAPLPGMAGEVLGAYRRYWTSVLMKQATPAQAEAALSERLARWDTTGATDLDGRSEAVQRALESQGWHALVGMTTPLHELMLWREQTSSMRTVALPDGDFTVKVVMLDGFASLGWTAWATCDRSPTLGWATSEGIMAVAPFWDLNSEAYTISLLAHETQHFSDFRRYPRLAQTDLEYRAKLTEIALADATQQKLLTKFSSRALRDRSLPHPFANHWVIERLRVRLGEGDWMAQPRDAIARAALAELRAHGDQLDTEGAALVESVLPD